MFCANCGAENNDSARFCIKCGADLTQQIEEQARVAAGQPPEPMPVQEPFDTGTDRAGQWVSVLPRALIGLAAVVILAIAGWLVFRAVWAGGGQTGPGAILPLGTTATITLKEIRAIAELATAEYRVVAEVQSERIPEDIRKVLGAKEQVVMLVHADVKAGFDLSNLSEKSLKVDGTRVRVVLPAPEILSVTLDHERTHIVYYKKSLLARQDIQWVDETLELADEAIRQEAIDMGILEKAEEFAKIYYENQFRTLGFTDVEVVVE